MNIKVWKNFKKRKNSTKQPSDSGATTIQNVRLKDNCNFENPVFLLNTVDFSINYIQAFGKYYYVESIDILSNDHAAYNCTCDLLASYKGDIQSTTAFVDRSASDFNKYLRDDSVSTFATVTQSVHDIYSMPFDSTGCFILSVINELSGAGAVSHYAVDTSNMQAFSNFMSNVDPNDPALQQLINWALINTSDIWSCVIECKWVPFKYSSLGNVAQSIRIGSYNITNVVGILLNTFSPKTLSAGTSIDISDLVPDDFRRADGYTSIELFVPMYGLVSLPATRCTPTMALTVKADVISGDIFTYIMTTGTDHTDMIASLNYNVSVSVPVAQVNAGKVFNVINAFSGYGKNMLLGAVGMANITDASKGILSSVLDNSPSAKGSYNGSSMVEDLTYKIYVKVLDTIDPGTLANRIGRPLKEIRTLSSLTGYVQCSNASVSTDATNSQTTAINQMLNSGTFLE